MNKEQVLKLIDLIKSLFFLINEERNRNREFLEKKSSTHLVRLKEIVSLMTSVSVMNDIEKFTSLSNEFQAISKELGEIEDFLISGGEADARLLENFTGILKIIEGLDPSKIEGCNVKEPLWT